MSATSDVVSLRRQLDRAVSNEDVERTSDVLKSLGNVTMTLTVLQESKIGASVAKLKKHADDGVSNSAKVLVRKWKRVAEASGVQGSSKSEGSVPSKDGGSPAGRAPGAPISNSKASASTAKRSPQTIPVGHGSASSGSTSDARLEELLAENGIATIRLKTRRKLLETILMGFSEDNRLPIASVARDVEAAIENNMPFASKKEDYLAKARQLVFNLKKNDQLREDVRDGAVAPARLVVMTSNELMAKHTREALDKAANDRTEARMLDWADKNEDIINKQCGITSQEGMFECGRCKSMNTTYTQKQTRSADEPMTTFVTCRQCNNRWKFC